MRSMACLMLSRLCPTSSKAETHVTVWLSIKAIETPLSSEGYRILRGPAKWQTPAVPLNIDELQHLFQLASTDCGMS